MRKININGVIWEYMIGKSYAVIKNPKEKKKVIPLTEIKKDFKRKFFEDDFGTGEWTYDPEPKENEMITPKDIRSYIEKNL